MFRFRDKVIYILSPENWGKMKVSKHHYAMELAGMGNRVYFLEPPRLHYNGIEVLSCSDHENIRLVRYKPVFRGKRILPEWSYRFLLGLQARKLLKAIGQKPDVVWCFHGYLFENLALFKAPVRIYFAADQFYYDQLPPEIGSASLTVGISDTICRTIQEGGYTAYRLNHGLHASFVESARRKLREGYRNAALNRDQIVVGFTGNLRMQALDRETMTTVIQAHPELRFIFWGSYQGSDLNLGGLRDEESDAFIRYLEQQPNVELRGVVDHEVLQREMEQVDVFWLCWKLDKNQLWDGSNSHKLLEYLSTGRPVVSHHVSSYRGNNLLYMMPDNSNHAYLQKFNWVLDLVRSGESAEHIRARLEFAVSNSYETRIREIEELVNHG